MRIAVVGPEGTGKSVLVGGLAAALHLPALDASRDALLRESGYHTLFEWVAAGNSWTALVSTQARREEAAPTDVVVDAGIIDQYCLFQRWGWNGSSPERAEETRDLTLAHARRYDRILVTPPGIVAGYASARFRNAAHNFQLYRLLAAFLSETDLGKRTCLLNEGTAEARVAQALAFVAG